MNTKNTITSGVLLLGLCFLVLDASLGHQARGITGVAISVLVATCLILKSRAANVFGFGVAILSSALAYMAISGKYIKALTPEREQLAEVNRLRSLSEAQPFKASLSRNTAEAQHLRQSLEATQQKLASVELALSEASSMQQTAAVMDSDGNADNDDDAGRLSKLASEKTARAKAERTTLEATQQRLLASIADATLKRSTLEANADEYIKSQQQELASAEAEYEKLRLQVPTDIMLVRQVVSPYENAEELESIAINIIGLLIGVSLSLAPGVILGCAARQQLCLPEVVPQQDIIIVAEEMDDEPEEELTLEDKLREAYPTMEEYPEVTTTIAEALGVEPEQIGAINVSPRCWVQLVDGTMRAFSKDILPKDVLDA